MGYSREFPGFKLGVKVPSNWVDVSWHNDTCPSFFDGDCHKVWVDYENPDEREQEGYKRFCVVECDSDGNSDGAGPVFESDNWAEVLAWFVDMNSKNPKH